MIYIIGRIPFMAFLCKNNLYHEKISNPLPYVVTIAFHVHDALQAEATRDEIIETIGIAILMGGGPAVMYGCEAMEALQQFETSSLENQS